MLGSMMRLQVFFWLCVAAIGVFGADYNGKLIGTGLQKHIHLASGEVYAVDDDTIRFVDLTYDGTGPDAFFYIGFNSNASDIPDTSGVVIPDEAGRTGILRAYNAEDITVNLPTGVKLTDLKWISFWCVRFGANFAHVIIPRDFVPPAPRDIGEFSRLAHGVRSGIVTILDSKTFFIRGLYYDGSGPDAFFYVGTSSAPSPVGTKVPDENASLQKLHGYTGQDVTIRLPGELTVFDINWLSIWCVRATLDFGHVLIPNSVNVPPFLGADEQTLQNCERLHDRMHVSWQVNGEYIVIELMGQIDPDQYMSFGLSGSDSRTLMDNADVVVAWFQQSIGPKAVDYYLHQKAQCSNGNGVCPDARQGGTDDLTEISGRVVDGITRIKFKRKLNTADSKDKVYRTDTEQYLAWAIGPINPEGLAQKHTIRAIGDLKLNFGRTPSKNCPDFPDVVRPPVKGWSLQRVSGENTKRFTAQIGQSGGEKGYKSITGRASWGIAWYINNKLIPEVTVKRGETYTFVVEGGNNTANLAEYHPFYITDDPNGGYAQLSIAERANVRVFVGIDGAGNPTPDAVGRLCEWQHKTVDMSDSANTFDDFFKTLTLSCAPGDAAELMWTPDMDTPDTVYYQCYQHKFLGWKIRVVDEFHNNTVTTPQPSIAVPQDPTSAATSIVTTPQGSSTVPQDPTSAATSIVTTPQTNSTVPQDPTSAATSIVTTPQQTSSAPRHVLVSAVLLILIVILL